MGGFLTGVIGNISSYIPDSVKNFVSGYGTYITAWTTVVLSFLHLAGLDTTSFGITDANAAQLFFGGLTAVFMRRAIGNKDKG